jgi:hypothetical protein
VERPAEKATRSGGSGGPAAILPKEAPAEHNPADSGTPRLPNIGGTMWRFPVSTATKKANTVEFLADGRFRWDGKLGVGFWKQDGGEVVLNVNDFTLFLFELDGDSMRGSWERIHGEDAGHKYPSSLQRVRE